jgi:hypothetical protein
LQHSLIAAALRQAAALELALSNPEAAGRRLVDFIEESKRSLPKGPPSA